MELTVQDNAKQEQLRQQIEEENRVKAAVQEVLTMYGFLAEMDADNANDEQARQRRRLHQNTRAVLQGYREVLWQLSEVPDKLMQELNTQLENIDALLDFVGSTKRQGPRYSEAQIENNQKLLNQLRYVQYCLAMLKAKPSVNMPGQRRTRITGKQLYGAIYLEYIDEEYRMQKDCAESLGVSLKTYQRWLRMGIEQLSEIMWGTSSPVLNQLIELYGCVDTRLACS